MDAGTTTILIHDGPTPAQERAILIHDVPTQEILAIDERIATTTERLEADFENVDTKIHRFPRDLRGIGGDNDRYIAPSVVAIGPYHRGSAHLQKMEEVKHAAAYHLCRGKGRSTMEVYEKVLSVVGAARGCYDADDPSVAGVSDADFAAMMFLDGCFLLQYMVGDAARVPMLQNRMTGPSVQKDIFLLENQIPWLVLEALTEFMSVDVHGFVDRMGDKFFPGKAKATNCWRRMQRGCIPAPTTGTDERGGGSSSFEQYKPPHLLGLLRFKQVGRMPEREVNYKGFPLSLSSSAVELAQIGVRLTRSTQPWFGDTSVSRGHLFGKLSLSPVFLNDVTASWLVNMAALEASIAASFESDGFVVSSYLAVLAMLMDRKEDVHMLREKRVLHGTLSNKQALGFFKDLGQNLCFGRRYFATLEQIEAYKRNRWVCIVPYKFVYNNFKVIAAVLSITGVLVGIFKTLLSLKHRW
ncbi:UPF0481 protein At3g47200-like [Phragmites australis]|uniref:UPF0481 protein At3g47200-like n=1 Tax=Phragmites australis TaxID=29695 RepID=UPI002D7805AE|nr:UPF0481 protein At3g47200-like [Phragmites australis]